MTHISVPKKQIQSLNFNKFLRPLVMSLLQAPELQSRGDRPLKMTFEDQIKALVYFHLQEHKSARHLVQDLGENIFAKENIAPDGGISRSSFGEAVNHRGLEQLQFVFEDLYTQAVDCLSKEHAELGELISIKRVRQLRIAILNDLTGHDQDTSPDWNRDNTVKDQKISITEQAKI